MTTLKLHSFFAKDIVENTITLFPPDEAAKALKLMRYKHSVAFTTDWQLHGNGAVTPAIAKTTIDRRYGNPRREVDAYTQVC